VNPSAIRRLLASPTVAMSGSLVLVAVAGYEFLSLAGTLPDRDKAATASFYVVVNTVGQGVFIGLEQEVSRSVSHASATGSALGPVVRRAVRQAGMLLAACLLLIAAISPLLVAGPLHGAWPLIGAVLLGTCTAALSYCARGLLGGTQQFGNYGLTLLAEGGTRLLPCLALAAVGAGSMLAYSYVYAFGLLFAASVGYWRLRPFLREALALGEGADSAASAATAGTAGTADAALAVGDAASAAAGTRTGTGNADATAAPEPAGLARWISASLLFLVGAGLLTQLVANLPALVTSSRLSHASGTAAAFVQAASLTRIPVLLTGPVTAFLMPRLTSAGARGDTHQVRTTVLTGVAAMLGLATATAAGLAVLGPWVLSTFFHAHGISAWSLAVMGVGTGGIMAVSVLQPALVGLGRQRLVPIGWGVGAAVMTAVLVWPVGAVTAGVAGSLVGPAVVAAAMGVGVLRGVGGSATPAGPGRSPAATEPTTPLDPTGPALLETHPVDA
jgi:O-antigen/teichoic acid export membrane protein